jgi:hypothetical protein
LATSWAHADWNKLPKGSVARRDALSDHIKEVSEKLGDTFNVQGKSHNPSLERYLDRLNEAMRDEFGNTPVDAPTPTSVTFVRGRAPR